MNSRRTRLAARQVSCPDFLGLQGALICCECLLLSRKLALFQNIIVSDGVDDKKSP